MAAIIFCLPASVKLILTVLCALSISSHVSGINYNHTIHIDPSTGEDAPDCLTGKHPCGNLTWVLQQPHSSSTHYLLSEGTHYLTSPTPPFQHLSFLALTGNSSVVTCTQSDTGLAFINVANITFHNVSFQNCSAIRNSTSKDFKNGISCKFRVGLYFYLCQSISMSYVSVSYSPNATGVVVYDTNGTNTFTDSNFTHNILWGGSKADYPGGGGFYVEFTYCQPGMVMSLTCPHPTGRRNDGATYLFQRCEFQHNHVDSFKGIDEFTNILPYKFSHQSFGRGGGLSLFIRGNASGIRFTVDESRFYNNTAVWGAGLFLELHDKTHSNFLTVKNTNFSENRCPYTQTNGTAGGGIRISHNVYGLEEDGPLPENATRNEIIVDDCRFFNNTALYGAGVSISWAMQKARHDQLVRIHIVNSVFWENIAKLGAAVHVDKFWIIFQGLMPVVWIENSVFDSNTDHYYEYLQSIDSYQVGYGIVCVTSSSVWFRGQLNFTNSRGSAVAVTGGSISFNGSYALFENNQAYQGAGIFMAGASTLEVGYGTRMLFRNNEATTSGGAIYIIYTSRENLITDAKCFIHHVDPKITPKQWNVSMKFEDNWGLLKTTHNSIHASTLLPCSVLGDSGVLIPEEILLCWEGWEYKVDGENVYCDSQISTDIGNITYSTGVNRVQAFPGWEFYIPVDVWDDLKNNISNRTMYSATINESNKTIFIYGSKALVTGEENQTYHLNLLTIGDRKWSTEVIVDLQQCPPGFKGSSEVCVCAGTYGSTLTCNLKAKEARLMKNVWMGLFNGTYLTARCPSSYCRVPDGQNKYILLPNSSALLNEALCAPNRTGTLCGECVEGFGPAINSNAYECVNCTGTEHLAAKIAKYVASVYLPLSVLFTVLIVFDIRLTTGPANAFILYAQVVSSTFGLDADGQISLKFFSDKFLNAYLVPYGIFNLEFVEDYVPPICFSSKFNTLTVLCLDYIVALFPLLMIILVLMLYKVKSVSCLFPRLRPKQKSSVFLRRQARSLGEALLPAFASFLLLSYTKFSTVSAYIVITHSFTNENGSTQTDHPNAVHLAGQFKVSDAGYYPYLVVAITVFCTFVAIPPLLLLDYPLRGLEWLISKSSCLERAYPSDKIHILLDTFQGCFRNRMRFFAGLYFLFRLVINVSYIFTDNWSQQFMVQQITCSLMVLSVALFQPYKRKFLNYVDVIIFTNLAVLNSLSFYLFDVLESSDKWVVSAFVLQYALVFLPLLYMLGYILWSATRNYHSRIKLALQHSSRCCPSRHRHRQLNTIIRDDSNDLTPSLLINSDALFARAKETNKYMAPKEAHHHHYRPTWRSPEVEQSQPPSLPVTMMGIQGEGYDGDATAGDSGMALLDSGSTGSTYGSTDNSCAGNASGLDSGNT